MINKKLIQKEFKLLQELNDLEFKIMVLDNDTKKYLRSLRNISRIVKLIFIGYVILMFLSLITFSIYIIQNIL